MTMFLLEDAGYFVTEEKPDKREQRD